MVIVTSCYVLIEKKYTIIRDTAAMYLISNLIRLIYTVAVSLTLISTAAVSRMLAPLHGGRG